MNRKLIQYLSTRNEKPTLKYYLTSREDINYIVSKIKCGLYLNKDEIWQLLLWTTINAYDMLNTIIDTLCINYYGFLRFTKEVLNLDQTHNIYYEYNILNQALNEYFNKKGEALSNILVNYKYIECVFDGIKFIIPNTTRVYFYSFYYNPNTKEFIDRNNFFCKDKIIFIESDLNEIKTKCFIHREDIKKSDTYSLSEFTFNPDSYTISIKPSTSCVDNILSFVKEYPSVITLKDVYKIIYPGGKL